MANAGPHPQSGWELRGTDDNLVVDLDGLDEAGGPIPGRKCRVPVPWEDRYFEEAIASILTQSQPGIGTPGGATSGVRRLRGPDQQLLEVLRALLLNAGRELELY